MVTYMNDEPIWKALSDKNRRRILDLLKDGPMTTGNLSSQFPDMTRFGVMKHLKSLYQANLVLTKSKEDGREVWNYLNAVPIQKIYDRWISSFQDQWASRLTNFKNEVENNNRSKNGKTKRT